MFQNDWDMAQLRNWSNQVVQWSRDVDANLKALNWIGTAMVVFFLISIFWYDGIHEKQDRQIRIAQESLATAHYEIDALRLEVVTLQKANDNDQGETCIP